MDIAVTTPTGNVGSRVTQLLVQAGVRPRVLAREPSKIDAALLPFVDVAPCDLRDADEMAKATNGVDTLFFVAPPGTMEPDPIASYRQFGEVAAQAIATNGISKVVFQSSIGAEARGGLGEIDGLAEVEQMLDATAASVTHIRCGYFFTNLLMSIEDLRNGMLYTNGDIDMPMAWVDPRDIAELATMQLLPNAWSGKHITAAHGPRDLTFREVAAIVSRVMGHEVQAVQVSDDDLRQTLAGAGMTPSQQEALVGMLGGMRDNFTPEQPRSVLTTTPTTLEAWVYANLT